MVNPILKKEINVLFRSKKIFAISGIYGFAMTSITALFVLSVAMSMGYGGRMRELVAIFYIIFALQLVMLYIIVPTITAGRISGERERQTLDMLLMTKMKEKDIIKGMMQGSLIVIGIIISVSLPVYGVMFYYEAVSLLGLFISVLYMMTNIFFAGGISIYFSARFKKTVTAMVTSLMVLFFYTVISFIGVMIISEITNDFDFSAATQEILDYIYGFIVLSNPITGYVSVIDLLEGSNEVESMLESCMNGGGSAIDVYGIFDYMGYFLLVMAEQTAMGCFFIKKAAKRLGNGMKA